ncbi:uncharacterized protein LOC144674537 [Cetorhinus maximus]
MHLVHGWSGISPAHRVTSSAANCLTLFVVLSLLQFVISGALTILNVDLGDQRVKKYAVIFNFVSVAAAALGAVVYIISTLLSRAGTSIYVARSPMLILVLLFLYCLLELAIALLVGIILLKK